MGLIDRAKDFFKKIFGKKDQKLLGEGNNEQESLKQETTQIKTTEEAIKTDFRDSIKIKLVEQPMGAEERHDKAVIVHSVKDGQEIRHKTSNLMLGYMQLPNGEYVNASEIGKALDTALSQTNQENEEITVKIKEKATGKMIDVQEFKKMIAEVARERAKLNIGERSPKIKNPYAVGVDVRSDSKQEWIHRGNFMLGKNGIQLPNGEYTNIDEIEQAIGKYVMVKQEEIEVPPPAPIEPVQPKKKETRWKVWPLITAAVAIASLGFGINKNTQEIPVQGNIGFENKQVAEYTVSKQEIVYENSEDIINRIIGRTGIGDQIYAKEGTVVHESSDFTVPGAANGEGTYGEEELLQSGNATIDYISLIDETGNIVRVAYDKSEGANIGEFIDRATKENGFDVNKGKVMIHISSQYKDKEGSVTGVQAGWTDFKDLINEQDNIPQVKSTTYTDEIRGTQYDYSGTINLPDGDQIQMNRLDPIGRTVTSVNGIVYKLDDLDIKSISLPAEGGRSVELQKVEDGYTLEWNIKNIERQKDIAIALAGIGFLGFAGINADKLRKLQEEEYEEDEFEIDY